MKIFIMSLLLIFSGCAIKLHIDGEIQHNVDIDILELKFNNECKNELNLSEVPTEDLSDLEIQDIEECSQDKLLDFLEQI